MMTFNKRADDWRYICDDCGMELDDDGIDAERWYERTEAGPMPCVEFHCKYCGSDLLTPAHLCNNDDCVNYARDGELLCEECYNSLRKRFVEFMDSLTACEKEQINEWVEDIYPDEAAERLKKGGGYDA